MMKKITTTTYLATFLWFTVFTFAAQAQVDSSTTALPFQIEEIESNGKTHILSKRPYIADINSTLRIKLDTAFIRAESSKLTASDSLQSLIGKSLKLQEIARQGIENLTPLKDVLAEWANADKKDVAKLDSALSKVAEGALEILTIAEEDSSLFVALDQALLAQIRNGGSVSDQYQAVFEVAASEAERLRAALDFVLQNDGIYYQLGAWIATAQGERPLHLEGFDDYPEGEEFEVSRWNLTMSADQKDQLQKMDRAARQLNEKGIKGAVVDFVDSAPSMIEKALNDAFPCIQNIEDGIERVTTSGGQTVQQVKNAISQAKNDILNYRFFLDGLRIKYTQGGQRAGGDELLASIKVDFLNLKDRTNGLLDRLESLKDLPDAVDKNSLFFSTVLSLKDTVISCEKQFKTKVSAFSADVRNVFANISSVKKINTALLKFGEEVKRHDIESLPDETKLNLKRTGVREAGDAIIIKFAYGKENIPRRVKDAQVNLYRIASHTDVVVSMIYARPQRNDKISGDFRLAPSYSVIFSWGSRGSVTYNTLFKPGIGISVAATDFNHDNTPEVGLGLVLSAFRNMLQAGIGYNLQEKVRYGFFGLHLPIPAITPSGG